ncbi:MAG: hypothetical protein HFG97_13340 [Dorea sp.]|nr:hypothetical protein [Dorea sp.]
MKEDRKKRIFFITVVFVAAVSLFSGWYFTLRKGIYIADTFYYKINQEKYAHSRSDYIEVLSKHSYKIVSKSGERTVSLTSKENVLSFSFSDGTSVTGLWNGEFLTDSDGLPLEYENIQITVNNAPVPVSDTAYCQALCRIHFGDYETVSAWHIQIFGILIYIWGLVSILYPDNVYFFLQRWRFRDPELSETGRLLEQAGGAVLTIMGIAIMSGIMQMLIH